MEHNLLTPEVQQFIREHEHDDDKELVLRHKTILGIPAALIAGQIRARRKAKDKIPAYYAETGILYPPGVNLEQSSSEETALFKTQLVPANCRVAADLTGGFGIDSFYLSRKTQKLHYVEPDADLLATARHNHTQMGAVNVEYHNTLAQQFIAGFKGTLDFVFIDPSRRSASQQKTFRLTETEPDITKLQSAIFEKTTLLLIKASPWLDIRQGLGELPFVKSVTVLSTANECKEILFLCEKGYTAEPVIQTINLTTGRETQEFTFTLTEEKQQEVNFALPGKYLYEPNAAILKAGAFKTIAKRQNLLKISTNTHLYTNEAALSEFPGRVFEIVQYVKSDAKVIQQHLGGNKANVITRNYPVTPEALKKKLSLTDGGNDYLIAFSGEKEKYLAIAKRLK